MRRLLGLVMILALMALGLSTVSAATRDGAVWRVGCEGFTSNGGGFNMTRDNTGAGREEFVISAVDGAGNTIFAPVTEDFFVGGSVFIDPGVTFNWTRSPQANPLTVSVVSPAGNGQPEQVVYTVSGTCSGLEQGSAPVSGDRTSTVDTTEGVRTGFLIVNVYRSNLRTGDGPEYTIVGQVSGGDRLTVLGVNQRRTWWFVSFNGLRGWINNELIINRGDLRPTPIIDGTGTILPARYFVYGDMPGYAEPSSSSPVVCIIDGNREYVLAVRTSNSSWYGLDAECVDGTPARVWIRNDEENGALRNLGNVPVPVGP